MPEKNKVERGNEFQKAIIEVRLNISNLVAQLVTTSRTSDRARLLSALRDVIRDFESWFSSYLKLSPEYAKAKKEIISDLDEAQFYVDRKELLTNIEVDGKTWIVEKLYYELLMDWLDLIMQHFPDLKENFAEGSETK